MAPTIIYSPRYTMHAMGLDRVHPFDLQKYRRAWTMIRKRLGDRAARIEPSEPATTQDLLGVHDQAYLDSLRHAGAIARAVEVPILASLPWRLLDRALLSPMRWATAGTVLGAGLLLEGREAINIGGGFHHASRDRAEGFCVYADIPLAILAMRRDERFGDRGRVLYIDLDAHMGNGVARCVRDDRGTFIFDMFNGVIYPFDPEARSRLDAPHPLPAGTPGPLYLQILRAELPRFLDSLAATDRPTVAIYNAGTDIYAGDALGGLGVGYDDVVARDRIVIELLRERGVPWLMVTSGGYSAESYRMIAETAMWALG